MAILIFLAAAWVLAPLALVIALIVGSQLSARFRRWCVNALFGPEDGRALAESDNRQDGEVSDDPDPTAGRIVTAEAEVTGS